jgi:hypothetical protein
MKTHPRYVPALLLGLCLTPSLSQAQPRTGSVTVCSPRAGRVYAGSCSRASQW